MCMLSHFICVRLFLTPWTIAFQASLSMGFWTELPCVGELILKAVQGVAWYVCILLQCILCSFRYERSLFCLLKSFALLLF